MPIAKKLFWLKRLLLVGTLLMLSCVMNTSIGSDMQATFSTSDGTTSFAIQNEKIIINHHQVIPILDCQDPDYYCLISNIFVLAIPNNFGVDNLNWKYREVEFKQIGVSNINASNTLNGAVKLVSSSQSGQEFIFFIGSKNNLLALLIRNSTDEHTYLESTTAEGYVLERK